MKMKEISRRNFPFFLSQKKKNQHGGKCGILISIYSEHKCVCTYFFFKFKDTFMTE